MRAAAITLFGKLAMFGNGPSRNPYLEQIHSNFITLLLHLHEEKEVRVTGFFARGVLSCMHDSWCGLPASGRSRPLAHSWMPRASTICSKSRCSKSIRCCMVTL